MKYVVTGGIRLALAVAFYRRQLFLYAQHGKIRQASSAYNITNAVAIQWVLNSYLIL